MEITAEKKAELAIRSLSDSCAMFAALSGGTKRFEGYEAWFAPETFWYHRVRLLRAEALPEVAAGIRAGELPPLLGWLDADFPGSELEQRVRDAGFIPLTDQTAMYRALEGYAPAAAPGQAEVLKDPAEAEAWAKACARAFGKPPETAGMALLAEKGRDAERVFLLWREGGEIAGGTLLCCAGGNGGIHEVFTLPEYRNRGIATALVRRALDLAAERGCACATLQASPLGVPVYRALGFEAVGTVRNWLYPPEKN